MLNAENMFTAFINSGIEAFYGVPDSVLKEFCLYLEKNSDKIQHIICANEGNAVGLAAGYNLTTEKVPAVYMQNSGLGNAINPILSLTHKSVYNIPILFIIGWRGEPNTQDEPQHIPQGEVTKSQLDILGVPYLVIDSESDVSSTISYAVKKIKESGNSVALLVKNNIFEPIIQNSKKPSAPSLKRYQALNTLLDLSNEDIVITSTGKISREVCELRNQRKEAQRDFLVVGSMGHTSSVALSIALNKTSRRIICIEGDGSALMHLGAIPTIAENRPKNFIHIILNNHAHESVGGQPTAAQDFNFTELAKTSGYEMQLTASTIEEIYTCWNQIVQTQGPCMLEIKVECGSMKGLGRPSNTPIECKNNFMNFLKNEK